MFRVTSFRGFGCRKRRATTLRESPVSLGFLMLHTYAEATFSNRLCCRDNKDKSLEDEASPRDPLLQYGVVIFNVGVIRILFALI